MNVAQERLSQTAREFVEQGAAADPIFVGTPEHPALVMLAYDRYIQLLDRVDELAIALQVRERLAEDDGTRLSLDEVFRQHGIDRADLEAEVDREDAEAETQ
jgi:hypothetical protein